MFQVGLTNEDKLTPPLLGAFPLGETITLVINQLLTLINKLSPDRFQYPRPGNQPIPINIMDGCGEVRQILSKVKKIEEEVVKKEVKIEKTYSTCDGKKDFKVEVDNTTKEPLQFISDNFELLHDHLDFYHHKEFCETDFVAAIPEWWQVRHGADRSQVVIQFAPKVGEKLGIPNKPISIPHVKFKSIARWQDRKPPISEHTRGQGEGIATLKDNSKIIVHCSTKKSTEKILEECLSMVAANYANDAHTKIGKRKGTPIKKVKVYAKLAKRFSQGQRDLKPNEIVYFKTPPYARS